MSEFINMQLEKAKNEIENRADALKAQIDETKGAFYKRLGTIQAQFEK